MTATLGDVTKKKPEPSAEQRAAEELVRQAREQGLSLTGPDGLLKQLTKTVLETALNQEMTEHLDHEKHVRSETGNVSRSAGLRRPIRGGTSRRGTRHRVTPPGETSAAAGG
jgi:putative transposase